MNLIVTLYLLFSNVLFIKQIPYSDPPVCSSPSRLVGKSWNQLQREDFACVPKVQNSVLAETGELTKAIEGENATLVCRLQATADTQVSAQLLLLYIMSAKNEDAFAIWKVLMKI